MTALLTPLLPYIRDDFSLNYTQAGWLLMAYNLAYGIGQLPGGWLADRIGNRIVLTIGVTGIAVTGLLIGLSPNYVILALLLVILGLAGGGYHPAAAPMVSASATEENRGKALGFHQIGGSFSFFLAPLITAAIAGALGWRGTFITLSIPAIAIGIAFYILLGRLGYTSGEKRGIPSGDTDLLSTPGHTRRLTALVILGVSQMVVIYSIISFIPLYIVDNFGASEEAAAAMLSLAYVGGIWAGPLGGWASDRFGRIPVILAVGLVAGPVIYLLNLIGFGIGFSVILVVIGTSMYLGMPVAEAYIISNTSEKNRSTVLGIYYLGSRGGPAIAPVIGYIIDNYGFNINFSIVGAAMVIITLFCGGLLWGRRN